MNFPKIFSRSPTKSTSAPSLTSPSSPKKGSSRRHQTADQPSKKRTRESKSGSRNLTPAQSHDLDLHPLNLPPEERSRYTKSITMSEPSSPVNEAPSSPPPSAPGAFPSSNGVNGENGDKENEAPRPPPHRSSTNSSPKVPEPTVDAEACKAAGNKFFKAKQYDKAVQEYTKGMLRLRTARAPPTGSLS